MKDPDRLASSIYFSEPSLTPEAKRQIHIFIEEGYLKCTSILLLPRKLLEQKYATKNFNSCDKKLHSADSHGRFPCTSRDDQIKSAELDVANNPSNWNCGFSKKDISSKNQSAASSAKNNPVYLAKKVFHERHLDVEDVQHDIGMLKSKLITLHHVITPKKRNRGKGG